MQSPFSPRSPVWSIPRSVVPMKGAWAIAVLTSLAQVWLGFVVVVAAVGPSIGIGIQDLGPLNVTRNVLEAVRYMLRSAYR